MPRISPQMLGLLGGAILGAIVAQSLVPHRANACSCGRDVWVYRRVAVDTPEGAADHTPYWPSQVSLQAGEGFIWIQPHLLDGADEPEVLRRVIGRSP